MTRGIAEELFIAVLGTLSKLSETRTASEDRIFSFTDDYVRKVFTKAGTRSGITPFRFHGLRHTFASPAAMQGVNNRTLMQLAGWTIPTMLLSPFTLMEGSGRTRYLQRKPLTETEGRKGESHKFLITW